MRGWMRVAVMLLVISVAVGMSGCRLFGPKEAVKIGAILPLSGPSGATGQEMRNAYTLALKHINHSGGVLGRELEIIIEDDANTGAVAVAAFEKLLTADEVDIIIGGVSSGITMALSELAKQYQPIMAWTGAAASLVEQTYGEAEWFFHYHPWEYHNVEALVAFLTAMGVQSVAIAHEDGLFGSSNVPICNEMMGAAGISIVATEPFKTGSADVNPLLTRIKARRPDAFVWIGYPGDVIPITLGCKEVGFNPKVITAYVPGWPAGFSEMPESEYVCAIVLWTPDIPTQASQEFVAAYTAEFGEAPRSYWAPLAYTNVITVAQAINNARSLEKDKVAAALAALEYDSPVGSTLKFTKSRICVHQGFTSLVTIQWRSGRTEIVWPAELATMEPVYPVPAWGDR